MLRMVDETVVFVQKKTADYAVNNPVFVPGFVNLAEMERDLVGVQALTPLYQQFEQLATDTNSIVMVAGSETYANLLTIHNNIKFPAKNNQPGTQTAYDDLHQRSSGSANAGRKLASAKA